MTELNERITVQNITEYLNKNIVSEKCEIYKDKFDSIVVHKKGTGSKTQIAIIINDKKLTVNNVNENKAYISSNFKTEGYCGAEVLNDSGVVGVLKTENEKSYVFLFENRVKSLDSLWIKNAVNCKGDILYGTNVWFTVSLNIVTSVLNELQGSEKDIYFTLSFDDISAKFTFKEILPQEIIYIYPVNEDDNLKLNDGFGLACKQGSSVCSKLESVNSSCKFKLYFGQKEDGVSLFYSSQCADYKALCVPVNGYNSSGEILNISDSENLIEFLNELLC